MRLGSGTVSHPPVRRLAERRTFRASAALLCLLIVLGVAGSAAADTAGKNGAGADSAPQQDAVQSAVGSDQIQHEKPGPNAGQQSPYGTSDSGGDSGGAGGDQQRTRDSLQQSESDPEIQHDRPAEKPQEPTKRWTLHPPDLGWLAYAILGVIAVALILVLVRYLHFRGGSGGAAAAAQKAGPKITAAPRAPAAEPEPERDRTFDEADALAAKGAFTEAVHHLLLIVQARLRPRVENGFQVSLTSREFLRRAKLPGDAATAFATLVAAVEISLFGMQAANAAVYQHCRDQSRRVLDGAATASSAVTAEA
jgi:hypothetical protein